MSLRYHVKHAAVVAAVAELFAVSGARAVDMNDNQQELASAFSGPVSAPCHPALAACARHVPRVIASANAATEIANEEDAPIPDPVSAPCHPALKACAGWKRAAR